MKPDRALLDRAAAGRDAIRYQGADPELVLSLVVRPTVAVIEATSAAASRSTPKSRHLTTGQRRDRPRRVDAWR